MMGWAIQRFEFRIWELQALQTLQGVIGVTDICMKRFGHSKHLSSGCRLSKHLKPGLRSSKQWNQGFRRLKTLEIHV